VFCNSVDAFNHLFSKELRSIFPAGSSIGISTSMHDLQNGIKHCSVQVIFINGEEYRIEAYGKEAVDLYNAAKKQSHANSSFNLSALHD